MQLRTQVKDVIHSGSETAGFGEKIRNPGMPIFIKSPTLISNFLTEPNSLTARINQIPYLRPQLHPQMLSQQNTFTGTINQIPYLDPEFFHQAQQSHCQN